MYPVVITMTTTKSFRLGKCMFCDSTEGKMRYSQRYDSFFHIGCAREDNSVRGVRAWTELKEGGSDEKN